jgi:hypothetical protein
MEFKSSPIFNEFWSFAAERQNIFWKRATSAPQPWTTNPIFIKNKFTQTYRILDRVSQYLVKNVIYTPTTKDGVNWYPKPTPKSSDEINDTAFRILFFKIFNRPSTWELFTKELGEEPSIFNWNWKRYDKILSDALKRKDKVFSNAYLLTAAGSEGGYKHTLYLDLLAKWVKDEIGVKVSATTNLKEVFDILVPYRCMGNFLGLQYSLDLNYSPIVNCDENDFVIAGPGTMRGIQKAFVWDDKPPYAEVISHMQEKQENYFKEAGAEFKRIGNRPLMKCDIANLFCEFDKYCRVAHPEIQLKSKRSRIKSRFNPNPEQISYYFPPKWRIYWLDSIRDGSTHER